MGSLFEELEAREVAARARVEELEAEVAELAGKLELARESLERLRIARETVAEVLAEMTPEKSAAAVDGGRPAERGGMTATACMERAVDGTPPVIDPDHGAEWGHSIGQPRMPQVVQVLRGRRVSEAGGGGARALRRARWAGSAVSKATCSPHRATGCGSAR